MLSCEFGKCAMRYLYAGKPQVHCRWSTSDAGVVQVINTGLTGTLQADCSSDSNGAVVLATDSVVPQRRCHDAGWNVGQTDDEIVRSIAFTNVIVLMYWQANDVHGRPEVEEKEGGCSLKGKKIVSLSARRTNHHTHCRLTPPLKGHRTSYRFWDRAKYWFKLANSAYALI